MRRTPSTRARRAHAAAGALGLVALLVASGCLAEVGEAYVYNSVKIPPDPAPDFTLTNESGEPFTLSELSGSIIVLTFTFTECRDICILIEANIALSQILIEDGHPGTVEFVSVTVDPRNDTVEALAAYMDERGYGWTHLTGAKDVLEDVWADWWVFVLASNESRSEVGHSGLTWIVDTDFKRRMYLSGDTWTPADLVEDLEKLIEHG